MGVRTVALLLLIVALAFGARLAGIERQSLWYDEGVSAYLTTLSLPEITRWTADDIQPPLYYYLLTGWVELFGRGEAGMRWLSVFASLLTVPLAWVAGRKLMGWRAGLLAACLFAASPLYIWYAQEARNYALLTFLSLISSLLLWDLAPHRPPRPASASRWLGYGATILAALYTHYFALFLLAFHGVYFLACWLHSGSKLSALKGGAAIALGILLGYLPWIPFLVTRYGSDESYWRGTLKLGEALRHTAIAFGLGETVLEDTGWRLAIGLLVLLAGSLTLLIAGRRRRAGLFLAAYLLLPLGGVILLAWGAPKFHPRYLMAASPAFFLILACGMEVLLPPTSSPGKNIRSVTRIALSSFVLLFVLGCFAFSLRNLYLDQAFSKADFRGAARYVREHRGPDDGLLLISGHMFPVFDHYYPDSGRLLIPEEHTLSVESTITFDVGQELNRQLGDKEGIWVVRWQDEVVDPNGILGYILEEAGDKAIIESSFWHVGLDYYRLPPGVEFSTQPTIDNPMQTEFGGLITFLGWNQPGPDEYALFWQALQPIKEDLIVSIRLVDEFGVLWGQEDRRPAAYDYPTFRWAPGEIVFGRSRLPAIPGTPPGEYILELYLYSAIHPHGLDVLDPAGAAVGKSITLGHVWVREAGRALDSSSFTFAQRIEKTWEEAIRLMGRGTLPAKLMVGDRFDIETIWHCSASPAEGLGATLRLSSQGGGPSLIVPVSLFEKYPSTAWRSGEWLRSRDIMAIPAGWPAGPAELSLTLRRGETSLEHPVLMGLVTITEPERSFLIPSVQIPSRAQHEGKIRLVGLDFEPSSPATGQAFNVSVHWEALADMEESFSVFIQLLDRGGQVLQQHDQLPGNGTRPTTGWVAGEVVSDHYSFSGILNGDTPVLAIGLYQPAISGMPRASWSDPDGHPLGDALFFSIPSPR